MEKGDSHLQKTMDDWVYIDQNDWVDPASLEVPVTTAPTPLVTLAPPPLPSTTEDDPVRLIALRQSSIIWDAFLEFENAIRTSTATDAANAAAAVLAKEVAAAAKVIIVIDDSVEEIQDVENVACFTFRGFTGNFHIYHNSTANNHDYKSYT